MVVSQRLFDALRAQAEQRSKAGDAPAPTRRGRTLHEVSRHEGFRPISEAEFRYAAILRSESISNGRLRHYVQMGARYAEVIETPVIIEGESV